MEKKKENNKQADDLQRMTELLNNQETTNQQTQSPQAPVATAAPLPVATQAPVATPPAPQMKHDICPSCKKDITVPPDFEEGLCPYCRGYLDFRPKVPTEIPKRISDQAMANVIQQQHTPPPQPVAPAAPIPQPQQQQPIAPTAPIAAPPVPPPLAPIAPPPPIPPQPQPQLPPQPQQQPYDPRMQPQQQLQPPSERFIDKRAAAMDVLSWLKPFKLMGLIAIFGSFTCLSLGMLYLDVIGIGVIIIITCYVAFILKKVTTHQNYLMQKYNLNKPTKQPKKPKFGKQQNQLFPQQPSNYSGGQY